MQTSIDLLLKYAWLLSLAIAVLFTIRYIMFSKALKKKCPFAKKSASEEMMIITEDRAGKEKEILLLHLIDSKIFIKTFLFVAVGFLVLSFFL